MAIGRDEVLHIAKLAHLEFSDEEIGRMTRHLSSILDYVAQLEALETSAVEPMSHVESGAHTLREDTLVPSMSREEALANAPEPDRGLFKVPKVIG